MRSGWKGQFAYALPAAAIGALLFWMWSGSERRVQSAGRTHDAAVSAIATNLADAPLAAWQTDLLDLAFDSASKMPIAPHVKNRSRAQAAVVAVCLELDQPVRALRYVESIANWQRGEGYARLASWCAQHGQSDAAHHYLDQAGSMSEDLERWTTRFESNQGWRRERIRSTIAATHLQLGQVEQAARFERGLTPAEAGQVVAARAARICADEFEAQIKAVDAVVASGDFDHVQNVLRACARMFDRFYADEGRRAQAEERVRHAYDKLPAQIRIELLMDLCDTALRRQDRAKAVALVEHAQRLLDGARWIPEHQVPLTAKLSGLRFDAGDEIGAREHLVRATGLFDAARDKIVDVYRAGPLRSLAESWATIGDANTARALYARAIEEGVQNPNSRPRAEDLSATVISMALHDVEPGPDLSARCRRIRDGLGAPW